MATLVKVSRKRDKKIRAVRGTVGLLDYDDLKRNFRKGYYYLGACKSKFQWYFYNVSHQLRTEKSINFSSFFLSLMKIILFLFIYLSHVHIIHAVQKPNENNIQSNTNTCKIQILHFIFNLKNNDQSFKYTIFVFFSFFFLSIKIELLSIRFTNERLLLSKFHYQEANGYFMRHDLISSYSPYPSRGETVYWNNQAKQIAFFGWNWSWIGDIPITDLLINRIESLALRSIKWFPTKTR